MYGTGGMVVLNFIQANSTSRILLLVDKKMHGQSIIGIGV